VSDKGVYKWSAIDRVTNSVMTFTGNIVLARLLDPSEFGLVAMVAIFTAIAQNLSSCGLSDGLIHKLHPTERDYSTVFVFNAVMGIVCGAALALAGWPLSVFFKHPQIQGIMIALGICFFFSTMCFTQETRMRKELEMKKMCIVRLSATASATILGIFLAVKGFGYWALICTQSVLSVFLFFYYVLASRWFPKIAFYTKSFREMFGYGVHLMVAYVAVMISRNISTAFLGRFGSPAASGFFSQAQKLEEVPFSFSETVFNWPFFAVLANEDDEDRRQILMKQMHQRLWVLNITIALLLLMVSWPAFNLLYGSRWDCAIPVFRLLLIYGSAASMMAFYQTVMKVWNRTRLVRNLTCMGMALQVGLLAVTLIMGVSIEMVAFSQVCATVIITCFHAVFYIRVRGIGILTFFGEVFRPMAVPAVASLITVAVAWMWYFRVSPLLNCILIVSVFVIAAVVACAVIKPPYYPALRAFVFSKLHIKS